MTTEHADLGFEVPEPYRFLYFGLGARGADDEEVRARIPIDEIVLERTMCYGTCPAYTVVLRRDGSAQYDGRAHVDQVGVYTGEVPLRVFARLCFAMERVGFAELENLYAAPVTDMPSCIITVRQAETGEEWTTRDYGEHAPPEFWLLAQAIDRVAGEIEWLGVGSGT